MTDNVISIVIDDVKYDQGFFQISVTTSLDNISGAFRIETRNILGTDFDANVIQRGKPCQIFVNDTQVIDGFIELKSIQYSQGQNTLIFEGRDKTADVIDSTIVGDGVNFETEITLKQLVESALKNNGITDIEVIDEAQDEEPLSTITDSGEDPGEKLLDVINKYAILRQVLLTTDGKGNIVLTRASEVDSGAFLINSEKESNKSNIIAADILLDDSQLYNKYTVYSQDDLGLAGLVLKNSDTEDLLSMVSVEQAIIDDSIRPTRQISLVSEFTSTDTECRERAEWERRIRLAESESLQYDVFGFNNDSAGKIWRPNQLVSVRDDFAGVNERFITKSVEFIQSVDGGSITRLTLINRDAYTLRSRIESLAAEDTSNFIRLVRDPGESDS